MAYIGEPIKGITHRWGQTQVRGNQLRESHTGEQSQEPQEGDKPNHTEQSKGHRPEGDRTERGREPEKQTQRRQKT